MRFMSCCIVQARKHTKQCAMKHSLTQSQHKTAQSRNKWGQSSFPLKQRKRIYVRAWIDATYFSHSSLKLALRIAVAGVKLCKDPLHCLPSIVHCLLLNDPQREAQPNHRYSKPCLYWFGEKVLDVSIRYHFTDIYRHLNQQIPSGQILFMVIPHIFYYWAIYTFIYWTKYPPFYL